VNSLELIDIDGEFGAFIESEKAILNLTVTSKRRAQHRK
jgi:hypothetical protein